MIPPVILPFRAIRYNLKKIPSLSEVIAPPYDVISPEQQDALYDKSPHNIVRLDLRRGTDFSGTQDHYSEVARDFEEWITNDILTRDDQAAVYVYEQDFTAPDGTRHTRRGFYGLRRLEPFGCGTVYPHERTLAGPKKDRLALIKATSAHLSPIFALFHDPEGKGKSLLQEVVQPVPLLECQDDSGQKHRLWTVTDPQWIAALNEAIAKQSFVIADGHHRYETALAYEKWRNENEANSDPKASFRYVLMFCEAMDDPGLLVLPTHRLLQNIPNFSADDFLEKVHTFFEVGTLSDKNDSQWIEAVCSAGLSAGLLEEESGHAFGLILQGDPKRYIARISETALQEIPSLSNVPEPLRSLDSAITHKLFIEEILGLPEKDQYNLERISYLKSEEKLLKQIQAPPAQVGILLNAAPLEQIEAIARAGQFMPPKTTYFYPKLPTGLLINKID